MNSQEKKIQGLKQKNRELTKTKMIFKPNFIDTYILQTNFHWPVSY
jgi:hypothetical protein